MKKAILSACMIAIIILISILAACGRNQNTQSENIYEESLLPVTAAAVEYDETITEEYDLPEDVHFTVYSGRIATGWGHSAAIDANGVLWTWGSNSSGQLGGGTTDVPLFPIAVMDEAAYVALGSFHTMAIRNDGSLWGWGSGGAGIGGYGNNNYLEPRHIMDNVKYVFPGHTSLFITYEGSLWEFATDWEWDYETYGEPTTLGIMRADRYFYPVKILDDVVHADASSFHRMAITSDGGLWAWGYNHRGQLGDGTTENRDYPVRVMDNIKSVATENGRTFAICERGILWHWGSNIDGWRANDNKYNDRHSPVQLMENAVSVIAEDNRAWVICTAGALWAWGCNERGILGDGTSYDRYYPVHIMDNIKSVTAVRAIAGTYTMAITRAGSLYTWGRSAPNIPRDVSNENILYRFSSRSSDSPLHVMDNVAYVVTGTHSGTAVTTDGYLWTWGSNLFAFLGDGTTADRHYPSAIKNLQNPPPPILRHTRPPMPPVGQAIDFPNFRSIATRHNHSAAIDSNGTLWTWGFNQYGALGDLTATSRSLPIPVIENVAYVSLGHIRTLAITTDGALWAWGRYLIGDGTRESSPVPVHIKDNVISVASGVHHTMVLTADGRLYGWGSGILAGTGENYLLPTFVMDDVISVSTSTFTTVAITSDGNLWGWGSRGGIFDEAQRPKYLLMNDVVAASAGHRHIMAITSDGKLWGFGNNNMGSLGDGTTESRSYPVHIMDNVLYVSAGWEKTRAITADGALWAWGRGAVVDGTAENSLLPVHIMDNVVSVSTSMSEHTLVLDADGALWAWGNNRNGQLGIGSTVRQHYYPVYVMSGIMIP